MRCREDGWMREDEGAGIVGWGKDTKQRRGSVDSSKVTADGVKEKMTRSNEERHFG